MATRIAKPTSAVRRRAVKHRNYRWSSYSDERLLDLRFCDLRLSLNSSAIALPLERLYAELRLRGLKFRPHVWLADEWFSPDGVPGFAIPFYLAHPRLERLERKMMREVEGGNANWLMRILRHETGHAIDTAYRLRRRKDWREVFGKASTPYPKSYRPRPTSRDFVLHLGHWYAQTHPTEDFAETFAVWLQPRSRWRQHYGEWGALDKLQYVDELMTELRDATPKVLSRDVIEPLSENTRTLREFYRREVARYAVETTRVYDSLLMRAFIPRKEAPRAVRAATLLRKLRPRITRVLTGDARIHSYLVHNVMRMIIDRCRELNLVVRGSQRSNHGAVVRMVEHIVIDTLYRRRQQYVL
jgi:hypothetical protein